MLYLIKFWTAKLFSKPLILTISFVMLIISPDVITKDLCVSSIKDLKDDYKLEFTSSDLVLLEIIENVDFNLVTKNYSLSWKMFKFWWKLFNNVIGNEEYKNLVEGGL